MAYAEAASQRLGMGWRPRLGVGWGPSSAESRKLSEPARVVFVITQEKLFEKKSYERTSEKGLPVWPLDPCREASASTDWPNQVSPYPEGRGEGDPGRNLCFSPCSAHSSVEGWWSRSPPGDPPLSSRPALTTCVRFKPLLFFWPQYFSPAKWG